MKSYFFNALATTDLEHYPSGFDREYDADDHAAFFAPFFSEAGVMAGKNADACKVQVQSGTTLAVSAGVVYIRGRMVEFDGTETITVDKDCKIVVRLDKSMAVRDFQLLAVTTLTRTDDVYDMELAGVHLEAVSGGHQVVVTDTRTYLSYMGQPPYYPPSADDLPYILWLYTMGYPMTAEQRAAVEGNPSLMAIYNASIGAFPFRRDNPNKVTAEQAGAVPVAGGTMTGALELSGNPTKPLHAVPKQYVDGPNIVTNQAWRKLWERKNAGAVTWAAPDLFGGKQYKVGIMLIGAGGSGAALVQNTGSNAKLWTSGGASGFSLYFERTVTPGEQISGVVGLGGAARVDTEEAYAKQNGVAGGSTSFDGKVANGGEGGKWALGTSYSKGAIGGQCSIELSHYTTSSPVGGYGGMFAKTSIESSLQTSDIDNYQPLYCFNPFENKKILGAGSGAWALRDYQASGRLDAINDPITGEHGGFGMGALNSKIVTAGSGIGSGNGGGSAAVFSTGTGIVATSGAGADGAVIIYVQGVPQ